MSSSSRSRRSRAVVAASAVALVTIGVVIAAIAGAFRQPGLTPAQIAARAAARARHRLLVAESRAVERAASRVVVALPTSAGAPAPSSNGALFTAPLPAHAVYGFVPYWEVANLTAADFARTSVLSYFGVEVGATGALVRSGYGWQDFTAPGFASFVAEAHAAHDRVLFTVSTTDERVIRHLTGAPGPTSARLADELASVVAANHLDGIDIDIEGRSAAQRSGFVTFVRDLSSALRRLVPYGEIVLDTYPQSASSTRDFFDVARLAPRVDALFVMAYDMDDPTVPSANSPLASPTLGLSDVGSLLDYVKIVPPAKLVLGLPFYGFDFTTAARRRGARVLGGGPTAVTYASVLAAGRPARWDRASYTPYTVYRDQGHWHETWYDDPVSLALKTALASDLHLAGVGAWALGQEGPATQMVAALDGGSAPLKLPITSPAG
ncbi:MAG TPA: glycoside hydrolase family 18 protein [Acidimicrobiales bacterium]|nr:glycoside hydrolase family 18 protein [Acidimicrobiales bacterium]